jgi:transcriptional regulator with XRE-family HTH domain
MRFSDYLQKRRVELDLSLADVADRLARYGLIVSTSAVSAWGTGVRKPKLFSTEVRKAIAAALEVDVNELMSALELVETDENRSPEALYVADMLDRLPEDEREEIIEYVQMVERRYLKKTAAMS